MSCVKRYECAEWIFEFRFSFEKIKRRFGSVLWKSRYPITHILIYLLVFRKLYDNVLHVVCFFFVIYYVRS